MSFLSKRKHRGSPRRRLLKWGLGTLAGLIILLAILFGLFRVAANMIPGYHDAIARQISTKIGAPVRLGRVSLAWHGWGPELQFRSLRIANPDTGKTVLSAKRLRLDFSLSAIMHGAQARPYAVALVAPRVTLQQMPDGRIVIPGLKLPSSEVGQLGAMLGEQLRVRQGRITLRLVKPEQQEWVFAPVNLWVSAGRLHAIRLETRMPAALGGKTLSVTGRVETRKADPGAWRWDFHYSLERMALAPLLSLVPRDGSVLGGSIGIAGKANGLGDRIHAASGRLTWEATAPGKGDVTRVSTHYSVAAVQGMHVKLSRLALQTQTHTWKPGVIEVDRHENGRIEADIARLDVSLLAHLGGFLPPSLDGLSQRFHKMQPVGNIHDFKLAFTPGDISSLTLQATLDNIGAQPALGLPGFNHISGTASLQHGMGLFRLDAPGLTVRMPHIFGHPVRLDQARGKIGIVLSDNGIRVATPGLELKGPVGLDGRAMAKIDVPWHGPVTMDIAAEQPGLMDAVAARARYFPAAMLPKPLVNWLMHQLDGGEVGRARLRFGGQVKQFPFDHGGGYFSVKFGFRDVTLEPQKGWEPLGNLTGSVRFKNAGMTATVRAGRIVHARVQHADVSIPDLANPHLKVQTEVTGHVSDFMAFLNNSPIGSDVAFGFRQFKTSGAATTRLTLEMPIMHANRFNLKGTFSLRDVDVKYIGQPYRLRHLTGSVKYDRQGPISSHMTGKLLDTPIDIDLSRAQRKDGADVLKIGLTGDFSIQALSKLNYYDWDRYARGHLPLHAQVELPLTGQGLPLDIDLTSSLKGLELKLPVPVGKSAMATMPFTAHIHVRKKGIGLVAQYAKVGSLCTTIVNSGHGPTVQATEIRLGQGKCRLPASGYSIVGGWPVVKLGDWTTAIMAATAATAARSAAMAETAGSGAVPAIASARTKASKPDHWPQKDVRVNVRFDHVDVFGEHLQKQRIQGSLGRKTLRLLLDGPDLAGKVLVPRYPSNTHPILIKLTKGHFTVQNSKKTPSPTSATASAPVSASSRQAVASGNNDKGGWEPRDIPPFSLHAAHLELGKATFDNVTISARRVPHGIAIKPIHIGGGTLSLDGQLVWLRSPRNTQGALQALAHIHHLGDLLQGLGVGSMATGHGNLSAALAWQKPSQGGEFAEGLLGKVSMDLRDGNISQVNPGAGRLLSLLNLVNIPRYLVFDFHNLFGEGFPFSRIYGDYDIDKGVAHTDAFRIDSSVADIKLSGNIDIVAGTMDQTALVQPNYFGSLPVIGALVGGLGVGAAIFVLSELFGNPIGKALELTYHIKGPITNPAVIKSGEKAAPQQAPAAATANAR